MSLGTRIKQIRMTNNLTQIEFGSKIGLTKSAISKVENDIHGISDGVFLNIVNEFCINKEWLMNGTGNQYNTVLQNQKNTLSMTQQEESLLINFKNLNLNNRLKVLDYIKTLLIVQNASNYNDCVEQIQPIETA